MEDCLSSLITVAAVVSVVVFIVIRRSTVIRPRRSTFIARGVIRIIIVDVLVVIVGSAWRALVIVGRPFFLGASIINRRIRVWFGSEDLRRPRSARQSKNTQGQAEQEREKSSHPGGHILLRLGDCQLVNVLTCGDPTSLYESQATRDARARVKSRSGSL